MRSLLWKWTGRLLPVAALAVGTGILAANLEASESLPAPETAQSAPVAAESDVDPMTVDGRDWLETAASRRRPPSTVPGTGTTLPRAVNPQSKARARGRFR